MAKPRSLFLWPNARRSSETRTSPGSLRDVVVIAPTEAHARNWAIQWYGPALLHPTFGKAPQVQEGKVVVPCCEVILGPKPESEVSQ